MVTMVNAQLSPQSKKVTKTFFPEMDFEIQTPAFQKTKGFTDYEEMMTFLEEKSKAHPQEMQIAFIGTSQKGKKIPLVRLNHPQSTAQKVKIWIQAGMHGNEPASSESIFFLKLFNENEVRPCLLVLNEQKLYLIHT